MSVSTLAMFYAIQSEANNVSCCLATKQFGKERGEVYVPVCERRIRNCPRKNDSNCI